MLPIGDAAARLGVPAHVLRHWEDVGVLAPHRNAGGHRRYTDDDLDVARLVRRLQRAGLSLAEIRLILQGDRAAREAVVADRLAELQRLRDEAAATIGFLEHTRACRHRLVARCPECDAYAHPAGLDAPR